MPRSERPNQTGHRPIGGTANCALAMLLLAAAAFGCAGCRGSQPAEADDNARPAAHERPALIRVATIEQRTVNPQIEIVGSVLPRHVSVVASGAEGLVEEYPVDAGIYVRKGDVLSRLRMVSTDLAIEEAKAVLKERLEHLRELESGSRPEEVAETKAKMLAAEAVKRFAETRQGRIQRLFERNAVNQEDVDDAAERVEAASQAYDAAKAVSERVEAGPRAEEIEQARARYEAQKNQVAFLEAEKEKRTTRAPFDGYVTKTHSYVGQWLSKGDPIITLALLDTVDVAANVDQAMLPHVRLGEKAPFRVKGNEQCDWQGTIVQIIPRSNWETGSRGFPVIVRLENKFEDIEGRRRPVLKEGMMAELSFQGAPVEALVVTKDALVRTSRGNHIYIFRPEQEGATTGTVEQWPVQVGLSDGTDIQVIQGGLEAGMQVVVEGAERLRPAQQVELARSTTAAASSGAETTR